MLNWLGDFVVWLDLKMLNRWLDVFECSMLLGFILLPLVTVTSIVLMLVALILVFATLIGAIIVGSTLDDTNMKTKYKHEWKKLISRHTYEEEEELDF